MRVAVTTTQLPFMRGGAEILADGLVRELRRHGHAAELITMPFRFQPPHEVLRNMDMWAGEDMGRLDCGPIDAVICLKFPTYYLRHGKKVVWLLHQHRAVYDLWNTEYSASLSTTVEGKALKSEIVLRDNAALAATAGLYTIARKVSSRLKQFNGIESVPLYHPPSNANRFYSADSLPYIFFPSRLQSLKRQELLIRSMMYVKSPVTAFIAGEGPLGVELAALVERLGLASRVRLLGRIAADDMLVWYANCLGVFYGPYDEDYGYVTLEAMLSAKPLITCSDSGGPLEFVIDRQTGYVVDPSPEAVADAIDRLYASPKAAIDMGAAGKARYASIAPSWTNVISTLLKGI